MIEIILSSVTLFLVLIILILMVRGDSDINKLRSTVELKQLKLNERAIDMQMDNTAAYLQGLAAAQEETVEEERTPVGYARED